MSILLSSILMITGARGDASAGGEAGVRVIEGIVRSAGQAPIADARVLFGQPEQGLSFVAGATATTDAQGRYRVDLGEFPWSTRPMQALVVAPGFKPVERTIEAGACAATADFELPVQPWKATQVHLEDGSGRPVVGVEVAGSISDVSFSRYKTDGEGNCRIAIPPGVGLRLSIEAEGALPVGAYLAGTDDEPASITIRSLPLIRGRVVDAKGQPVPGAAVGKWLAFDAADAGKMVRSLAVTDRDGGFVIAPKIWLHRSDLENPGRSRPDVLCFADAGFQRMAYRVFDRARATEPMEVTLGPTRRVRIPIARELLSSKPGVELTSEISIVPRPDIPDLLFFLITREMPRKSLAAGTTETPVIEEDLPAGTYELSCELYDTNAPKRLGFATRKLVVPEGEGPLEALPLTLEPPSYQGMVGKPAPEISAIDLGTGRPATLSEFRGKVVLLDFWGYWCGPCLLNMKHLMELQRKFEGRPLTVVALHDQSVQSRVEYDQKLEYARRWVWGGRDLPFRVLLDRPDPAKSDDRDPEGTGVTVLRYGIQGFPSLFVIDHDGTMVGKVTASAPERLESLLRELVQKAEARGSQRSQTPNLDQPGNLGNPSR